MSLKRSETYYRNDIFLLKDYETWYVEHLRSYELTDKSKSHTVKYVHQLTDQMPQFAYKVSGKLILTNKHFIQYQYVGGGGGPDAAARIPAAGQQAGPGLLQAVGQLGPAQTRARDHLAQEQPQQPQSGLKHLGADSQKCQVLLEDEVRIPIKLVH
ncbi:hypothetical protein N1851_013773 [Merluccius polli]|uniref:Uncharacterized protein n=1 Tax=Merluccius polli TaxID=89951 RepID=A0AA47P1F9_MERPO|nr:hypothetical protein N1851_013773 [Merluccius polli]